jgi:hypothetical protein
LPATVHLRIKPSLSCSLDTSSFIGSILTQMGTWDDGVELDEVKSVPGIRHNLTLVVSCIFSSILAASCRVMLPLRLRLSL